MYKRYIDDIFIFVDEEYFNAFSDQLNRIHTNISVADERKQATV